MDFSIKIKGVEHKIVGQVLGPQIWVHVKGRTLVVDRLAGRAGKGRQNKAEATGHIFAPMPGKITKVMASLGNSVVRGQPLLVMEAMKMEYTLKADMDGPVSKILCLEGQQVSLGTLLVEIGSDSTLESGESRAN